LPMPSQTHSQNTAANVHIYNCAGAIVRKTVSWKPLKEKLAYITCAQA